LPVCRFTHEAIDYPLPKFFRSGMSPFMAEKTKRYAIKHVPSCRKTLLCEYVMMCDVSKPPTMTATVLIPLPHSQRNKPIKLPYQVAAAGLRAMLFFEDG
jgi:hypothetical protein